MKIVYLDTQIVIDHLDGLDAVETVAELRKRGLIFVYSPAHVEEIAKAHHAHQRGNLDVRVSHLAELTGEVAILPHETGPAVMRKEAIAKCLGRVQDGGGREMTEFAVAFERRRITSNKASFYKTLPDKNKKAINNCLPSEIFSNMDICKYLEFMARTHNFRIRKDNFPGRQDTFETLFDTLNIFGYRAEHNSNRVENRVHDVSHAIYASYADIFVTDDRKLSDSSKAVFHLLDIDVEVMDRAEFRKFGSETRQAE
jgi:hypothetical protein